MNKLFLSGLMLSLVAFSTVGVTAEFKPSSVRSLGMGGSNVASTNGVDATYWNPAAYGFFGEDVSDVSSASAKSVDNSGLSDKGWGVDTGAGAGLSLYGPIADTLNVLQSLTVPTGTASFGFTTAQVVGAADFINGIRSLSPDDQGVNVFADAAVGTRVANYGLGVRGTVDINVGLNLDLGNIGFGTPTDFINAFTGPALPGTTVSPGGYFTATQQDAMRADLVAAGYTAGQAASVVLGYDASLLLAGTPVSQSDQMAAALVDLGTAPGNYNNNTSTVDTLGVSLTEVGFTYGYAVDETLSVGGVIKYMRAEMIVQSVSAFNYSGATNLNRDSSETVAGVGLDLGVLYRMPDWQFGLTVRNLNSPSFEHSSGYVYELRPQAKVGAAWMPLDTVVVELGYDLTENEGAVASSKSQYWNAGVEWNAWKILALRAGAFQNTSQTDIGLVTTLGLGVNFWAARFDAGVAWSTKKSNVKDANVPVFGDDVPRYLLATAALAIDF